MEVSLDQLNTIDNEIIPKLVIAIDFGTYASGFALQWRANYEDANCLESIKVKTNWKSTPFCTRKTPSCLLLRPDKSVAKFGNEADFEFSMTESLPEEKRPKDWKNWYFFRYFKMRLYCGDELTLDTQVEAANNKFLPVFEVLATTIAYLKDEAIGVLEEDGVVYPEEETKWVITVPAIWKDSAKHVMHEAAQEAGIMGKNLSIALEPECAAIYCSKLPLDKLDIADAKENATTTLSPGQTLMVVDMGGGTIDITTIQINEDGTMKHVAKSGGGPWGGTTINDQFETFLKKLIGAETMKTFVQTCPMDYYDLRMDFENCKRQMTASDKQIGIKFPESLRKLWKDAGDNHTIDAILEHKKGEGNVTFNAGRLWLDASIVHKFFQGTINGILGHMKEDILPGIHLDSLLLVGGFAESSYVLKRIREGLKDRNIPVIRPVSPETAVLNGAVLFGQNDKIVVSRMMRFTYGVAMTMEFVSKMHEEDEKYKLDGKWMANNVFRKHVTIGDTVKSSQWLACKEYYPESEKVTKTTIYIFTSDKKDPIHTTESGSEYIGQVDVEFRPNGTDKAKKGVTVEFNFGGTELRIRALTKSGNGTYIKYLKIK